MNMAEHVSEDWCHLCGKRSSPLADIRYPENAEHGGPDDNYIRICAACGQKIVDITAAKPTVHP